MQGIGKRDFLSTGCLVQTENALYRFILIEVVWETSKSLTMGLLQLEVTVHLIQKRLSSELLHCALCFAAYPDRKAPWM